MRNLFLALLVGLFTFSFVMTDAQAKRFGGGKSFGVSRQASSFSRPNTASTASATTAGAAAKTASGASKWLGPLAGLAVGGLLASLFMGHGFGSGMMSWLLIGGLVFFAWRFIRSRMQPATQAQGASNNMNYQAPAQPQPQAAQNFSMPAFGADAGSDVKKDERVTDFNETDFLRNAKAAFIRLQAAYDSGNLADIREFASPEIFAEIQLQLQERGNEANQTDVIAIDAELLDLTTESHMMIASVQFSGSLREQQGAEPVNIKEIWHFHKFDVRPNWVVAGIQQA
jgi:predicted lipid-binding transport protein (Tim44 family)